MRIAICDDEEKFRVQEKNLIDRVSASMDIVVDTYAEGKKLLERFDTLPYNLVFLDIEMPGMDGITLAREIRKRSTETQIVFLTGHVEYAIEGYEVNALRYLTKPVQEEKVKEVLRYVLDASVSGKQLILREEGEDLILKYADIYYMEAQNQYVMIYSEDGEHLIRANIGDFEEQLKSDGFYRIHRGYLVSLSKVKKLVKGEVIMQYGAKEISLPVSRSNIKPLKEALYAYVENAAF
ncbi:MAG: response regulator transcription factor [Lachnospiraceae bacterium]|nr:response regulator transcription factor [Lachnospiraceae bacterium]